MIICDKCRQNKKIKIVVFGRNSTDWHYMDNWDLCDECEQEIKEKLNDIIGTPSRKEVK